MSRNGGRAIAVVRHSWALLGLVKWAIDILRYGFLQWNCFERAQLLPHTLIPWWKHLQRPYTIMEASSPLAAMQAPSFMPAWGRNDLYTSHPHSHLSRGSNFGPGAFDFRDLSMKRPRKPDYFAMKPVRGSSPTTSLAADLSQNFHIDMR